MYVNMDLLFTKRGGEATLKVGAGSAVDSG